MVAPYLSINFSISSAEPEVNGLSLCSVVKNERTTISRKPEFPIKQGQVRNIPMAPAGSPLDGVQ